MAHTFGLTGLACGLQMSLIAFCTVFLVIAFLMIMITALHKMCYIIELRKDNSDVSENNTDSDCTDETAELIAVITAAVAQYTGAETNLISFRPSPVQPPKKSAWRNFGRLQNFERNI